MIDPDPTIIIIDLGKSRSTTANFRLFTKETPSPLPAIPVFLADGTRSHMVAAGFCTAFFSSHLHERATCATPKEKEQGYFCSTFVKAECCLACRLNASWPAWQRNLPGSCQSQHKTQKLILYVFGWPLEGLVCFFSSLASLEEAPTMHIVPKTNKGA